MNFVALEGVVTSEPRRVELPSGDLSVSFDLRTQEPGQRAQSVPVEWTGTAARPPRVDKDFEVAVIGTIRRRFYRAGGVLQSKVYVQPTSIIRRPARRRRALQRALTDLLDALA